MSVRRLGAELGLHYSSIYHHFRNKRDLLGAVSLLLLGPLVALAVALALALLFIWVRAQALDRIGGQTGDILGALQQLAEISILCAAAGAFA